MNRNILWFGGWVQAIIGFFIFYAQNDYAFLGSGLTLLWIANSIKEQK